MQLFTATALSAVILGAPLAAQKSATDQVAIMVLDAELGAQGFGIRPHGLGLRMTHAEIYTLFRLPEQTGGRLILTSSGPELAEAKTAVSTPEPEPEVAEERSAQEVAEADTPDVSISGPGSVRIGESFEMQWSVTINERDIVAILPMGVDEGELGTWARVGGSSTETELRAPSDPGMYELRYILDQDLRTLATAPIEVVTAEAEISGPDTVRSGENFRVQWSDPINSRDLVAIVPMGADEGELGTWSRVGGSSTETELRAPPDPGMYQLRYILDEGRRTLASASIEVTTPEAEISGPDSVRSGESFRVQWSDPINDRDIVAIVPVGAEEGELGTWSRVGKSSTQTDLRAPSDTGVYELRYILDEGRRTLASASIEVTTAGAEISGPDSVRIGESFGVQWSDPINDHDIVAIVPMGADEGELGIWSRVGGSKSETELRAPSDPGVYELRYILDEGRRTLATASVEVTGVELDVMGPEKIRAGDSMRISWSDRVNERDIVAIVPMGADEGEAGDWVRIGKSAMQRDFDAPEETGMYEVRYILAEGRVTLGHHVFEVVDSMAALGDGIMLTVPEAATPGETITVSWIGNTDGANQRIALARADQALFTWISAHPIEELSEVSFTLPDEPGFYEIRLLDLNAQDVLSRARIEVR